MAFPLLSLIVTGTLTGLFVTFLLVERVRDVRYFGSLRRSIDRGVVWIGAHLARRMPNIDVVSALRAIFHYSAHHILAIAVRFIRKFESLLLRVIRFNRSKALHVAPSQNGGDPHLKAIAEHKESVSLSAAEKRKRKNKALHGEL